MTDKLATATQAAITRIRRLQAADHALFEVSHIIRDNAGYLPDDDSKRLSDAVYTIHGMLCDQLAGSWEHLSYLAPISKAAADLLHNRALDWFSGSDHHITDVLGLSGRWYVKDIEAFRDEVLVLFGVVKETNNA